MTITIQIKPHLKKFLYYLENISGLEPWQPTKHSTPGMFILGLLCSKSRYIQSKKIKIKYSQTLAIQISKDRFNKNLFFITDQSVIKFNGFLNHLLNEHIDLLVRNEYREKKDIKSIIENFRDKSSISEDELSFDAIKKANFRLRELRGISL